MKKNHFLLFAIVLIYSQIFGQAADNWTLKKDKNDIKVYTRLSEGTGIIEIKVSTSVNATVNQISKLLADVETYNKWMPNVKSTKVIKNISKNELYYYIEMNAPWPISNRDNIIHYHHTEDANTGEVKIYVDGIPDYLPENSGIVRIVSSHGIWQLTPRENGETEILSTYLSDPSGSFPQWVIKMFVVGSIYDTFINLKKLLQNENQTQ